MTRMSKQADEYDVVSPHWRRHYGYMHRPGVVSAIKRRMRRRERRQGKFEARSQW